MTIRNSIHDPEWIAGVLLADGVTPTDTPEPLRELLLASIREQKNIAPERSPAGLAKEPVRNLLRRGGFRPSGRNKPASEYLAQAAREDRFPFINNLVDINNLLSLESGLPISMLDLDLTGPNLELRLGRPGERYVFNGSGQEIELEGLISICRQDGAPLGNPIKDSMEAKLKSTTCRIVAVIYSTTAVTPESALRAWLTRFETLMREHGGTSANPLTIRTGILRPGVGSF